MSTEIKWRFESSELCFISAPEKLQKHINKARRDLEIHPDEKIIFEHDYRPVSPVLLDSGVIIGGVPYSSMAEFYSCNTPRKTPKLPDVPNILDQPIPTPTPLPTPTPAVDHGSISLGRGL